MKETATTGTEMHVNHCHLLADVWLMKIANMAIPQFGTMLEIRANRLMTAKTTAS